MKPRKLANGMYYTENKLYHAMLNIGLDPKPQYQISDMTVDFAFPDHKLVVEVNGKAWHSSEDQISRDRKRWFVLRREGWRRRSYPAEVVFKNPYKVAYTIKTLLETRFRVRTKEDNLAISKYFKGCSSIPEVDEDTLEMIKRNLFERKSIEFEEKDRENNQECINYLHDQIFQQKKKKGVLRKILDRFTS